MDLRPSNVLFAQGVRMPLTCKDSRPIWKLITVTLPIYRRYARFLMPPGCPVISPGSPGGGRDALLRTAMA